jgi:thioesterase domain-containing protein
MCWRPAGAGTLLVAIPNIGGHAGGYKALTSVVDNPIYGAIHPHMQTGSHLQASTLEEFVDAWAIAILQECKPVNSAGFCLIGTSLGGLLAHQTALSAREHGRPPRLLFLVEPRPPIRPLSTSMEHGLHSAALFIGSIISGDDSFKVDVTAEDADYGCQLAGFAAERGLIAFTPAAVLDWQRLLRATTHIIDLAAIFTAQEDEVAADVKLKVSLVTASEREHFFMNICHLTQEESGVAAARLYGDVVEELSLRGTHGAVCAKCVVGDVDEFNALLRRQLCGGGDALQDDEDADVCDTGYANAARGMHADRSTFEGADLTHELLYGTDTAG